MRKFVFVDTNIFEHFPPLPDIDWAALANCTDVTIVITQATIRELNRHKDTSQKPRQKRRAAEALRKLSEWAKSPSSVILRPSVDLMFRPDEPLIDFSSFHLRHEVPDDELLASAIEFAVEKHLAPQSVLVSSADLGLQLKGQSQKTIGMLPMPESLRLPDEPDAEEKRVKELEKTLQQLSNRLPKLQLTFSDGQTFEERSFSRETAPVDEREIAESMRTVRAEHPYLAEHPCPPQGWTFSRASKVEQEQYNKELHKYFVRYENFLRDYIEARNWQARTRSLLLSLDNSGSVPAEEISIFLRFPEGIEIVADSDFKGFPTLPTAPDPPKVGGPDDWPNISADEIMMGGSPQASEASNAVIKRIGRSLGCFEVELFVSRVKHTFCEQLPVLTFHFPKVTDFKSFQFTYKMVASNFPQPIEGKLNMKIVVRD